MRVLHVEAGRHLYGGARQVLYLMQGLHALGFENVLVCPSGSAVAEAAAPFAEVHELPWRAEVDWGTAGGLIRIIRAAAPTLLHAHSRRGADWFTALAAVWTRLPALLTRRVDNPEAGRTVRWKYGRYKAVVAVSRAVASVLEQRTGVPETKLHVIPSAVDAARFAPAGDGDGDGGWLRRELALPARGPIGVMVAQFIARKGHHVLLDALGPVFSRHPDLSLLMFGRGPEEPALRARVQSLGWQQRVRFCGYREDLHRILPAADFLVHPAATEGLGVALLEAGACGLPVVAARSGGIPEVVVDGKTGLLVPPNQAPPLTAALLALLASEDERRRLGAAARAHIEREFSLAAMTGAYAVLYGRLAAAKGEPADARP